MNEQTYATGIMQGRTFFLYNGESLGRPNIIVWTKRNIMSNAASAASWILKQFRIPFDVKIHIDNVFAKNINIVIYIFILSNQFKNQS